MNFSDIPQFTRDGSYNVDIPLDYLKEQLERYKGFNLELNPDFQRGNVWTREQQIAWLEFFFRGGKTSRTVYFNCPEFGTVTPDCDIPNTMYCVDGLQRLTALLGFLNNEIPIFGSYYKEFEGKLHHTRHSIRININSLQTRDEVLQWYIDMNTGGTVHTKEEIERVKSMLSTSKQKASKEEREL